MDPRMIEEVGDVADVFKLEPEFSKLFSIRWTWKMWYSSFIERGTWGQLMKF